MRLTIERLGRRGDGFAPGPVHVPRTLPGEVVEGVVEAGRIDAPRILQPSAERVTAPCPHYRVCGGCHLMHARDGFVEGWKADQVRRALSQQGVAVEIAGVRTSPPRSRRRAVLSGRRTKSGAMVGFHFRASASVTAIPECRLLHPDLMAGLPALEALTLLGCSRKGEITLHVARSRNGLDVAVSDAKAADAALRGELAAVVRAHPIARLAWNGEVVALSAPPTQAMGRASVTPPPGAFLQATEEGEAALVGAVRDAVAGTRRVVDLFAGAGTFTLPVAERAEVHAVEGDSALLAALDVGWRGSTGLRRVTTEVRDLFRRPLLRAEFAAYEAAVIDPPRAGAEAQTRALAEARVPVVVSVSCNPGTFARDARILVDAGYAMAPVLVVDQFRWSPHVELVARFVAPGRRERA
ncbi:class I SAM-dependent RNA methyltransferase [Roseitranquillus sediminis]|uniref:class I SAM-dependent RNA methyltransferase n=1 Tax=Roseitranquillus sediminis TaxID=2809051 RepID=UPI001D0BF507|nr:class I SAM-dependent RNA methyltransferase [Roseitranquillus sediminis]MBM9593819.1 class I SAM-dependent RNA methyltransferase [Roseitranquillus sediminis]